MCIGLPSTQDAPLSPEGCSEIGYRLLERIGKGGAGEIWMAEGPGQFQVALKIVPLENRLGDREFEAMEILRSIRHPHLRTTFGSWVLKDHLVFVMELADRSLWDQFLEVVAEGQAGIPRVELLDELEDAAEGIDCLNDYQHAIQGRDGLGIQHCDIKPQNLLLFGSGLKVADLGMARLLDRPTVPYTGHWTFAYAPPEFFHNQTSRWSDQYSLAVTYCQLRTGRLPFRGSPAQIMLAHLIHEPDLSALPEFERPILARALEKEPSRRWPDCRALVQARRLSRMGLDLVGGGWHDPSPPEAAEPPDAGWECPVPYDPSETTGEEDSGSWSFDAICALSDQEIAALPDLRPDASCDGDTDDGSADDTANVGGHMLGRADCMELADAPSSDEPAPIVGGEDDEKPFESDAAPNAIEPAEPPLTAVDSSTNAVPRSRRRGLQLIATFLVILGVTGWATLREPLAGSSRRFGSNLAFGPGMPTLSRALYFASTQEQAASRLAERLVVALKPVADRWKWWTPQPRSGLAATPPARNVEAPPTPEPPTAVAVGNEADRSRSETSNGPGPILAPITKVAPAGSSYPDAIPQLTGPLPAPQLADRPARDEPPDASVDAEESVHQRIEKATRPSGSSVETNPTPVSVATNLPRVEAVTLTNAGENATRDRHVAVTGLADSRPGSMKGLTSPAEVTKVDHLRRGLAYYRWGEYLAAIHEFDEAIRVDPGDARSRENRGAACFALGRYDEAIADLDTVIRLNPRNAVALNNRGLARRMKKDYALAIADYNEAIRLTPTLPTLHYNRAVALTLTGRDAEAIASLSEALRLDPNYDRAYQARGEALARQGERARAEVDLVKARQLRTQKHDL